MVYCFYNEHAAYIVYHSVVLLVLCVIRVGVCLLKAMCKHT